MTTERGPRVGVLDAGELARVLEQAGNGSGFFNLPV
jgi:hypothetical protein